jgi:transposase-like protein
MSHYDKTIQDKAKTAFLAGETIAAIARRFEMSRRQIERWAEAGNWREEKKALGKTNVVPMQKPNAKPQTTTAPPTRSKRKASEIDELEIVELAIADLSAAMYAASKSSDDNGKGIDVRALGGLAGGLVRLLEYRRKICPPTAAELAELAIALGCSPETFMQALHETWRKQA